MTSKDITLASIRQWCFHLECTSLWHPVIWSNYGLNQNLKDANPEVNTIHANPLKFISQGYVSQIFIIFSLYMTTKFKTFVQIRENAFLEFSFLLWLLYGIKCLVPLVRVGLSPWDLEPLLLIFEYLVGVQRCISKGVSILLDALWTRVIIEVSQWFSVQGFFKGLSLSLLNM